MRERHYTQVCSIARPKYKPHKFYKPTTAYGGEIPKVTGGGLKYGNKSDEVGKLQKALSWANGYKLAKDNHFGGYTFAEVVIFQLASGLKPDGQFGEKSLAKLKELIKIHGGKPKMPQEKETAKKTAVLEYEPKPGELCYDLSNHQGKLSKAYFKGIMDKSVKSVILRSSYTRLASPFRMEADAAFKNNIENAIAAGMHIGIYHYSSALTPKEAKKEAEFCLSMVKPYREHIDLPIAFDCEFGSTVDSRFKAKQAKSLGKTGMGKIVDGFCETVKDAGYDTMVYANLVMLNNYLPADLYRKYKIWVAQYYKTCEYKHPWYLWQFTSNNGKLDENRFDSPEPVDEKPQEVYKRGDSGEAVKEVQKKLNKASEGHKDGDIKVDGEYGPKTEKRCRFVQEAHHIKMDGQFGQKTQKACEKPVTKPIKAVNWAISIAKDNSFAYGEGARAHHNGCYFCGTNIHGPKKAKKGSRWEKTYCCNPFIHAAYAHGAGIKPMLTACKNKNAAGMRPGDWTKYGFKNMGKCSKVDFKDLEPGDVIICDKEHHHVFMFAGGNGIVEASGGTWSKDSIAHKRIAKSRYKAYQHYNTAYVLRYKG